MFEELKPSANAADVQRCRNEWACTAKRFVCKRAREGEPDVAVDQARLKRKKGVPVDRRFGPGSSDHDWEYTPALGGVHGDLEACRQVLQWAWMEVQENEGLPLEACPVPGLFEGGAPA